MRQNELDNMKFRSALIDKQLEDPSKVEKLRELARVRWRPSLATITRSEAFHLTRNQHDGNGNDHTVESSAALLTDDTVAIDSSNIGSSSGVKKKIDKKPRNLTTEMSVGNQLQSTANQSQQHHRSYSHNDNDDDDNDHKSVEERILRTTTAQLSSSRLNDDPTTTTTSSLPKITTKAEKLKKDLFEIHKNDDSDFYLQIVEDGSSMHRSKDYSKVMKIEKIDEDAYLTTGSNDY